MSLGFTSARSHFTDVRSDFTDVRTSFAEVRLDFAEVRLDFAEVGRDFVEGRTDFVAVRAPLAVARGPFSAGGVPLAEERARCSAVREDLSIVPAYISGVDDPLVDARPLYNDENFFYITFPRPITAPFWLSPTRRATSAPIRASNLPSLEPNSARKKNYPHDGPSMTMTRSHLIGSPSAPRKPGPHSP